MGGDFYLLSSGTLKRKENTPFVESKNGERKHLPVENLENIHIFGEVDINTKLLNFLS